MEHIYLGATLAERDDPIELVLPLREAPDDEGASAVPLTGISATTREACRDRQSQIYYGLTKEVG